MEELKVGMYVRTKKGRIAKIIDEIDNSGSMHENNIVYKLDDNSLLALNSQKVKNASHNITDLIEGNDIILGYDGKIYQVWKIYKDYVFTYSKNKYGQTITLVDYQIDKILTKEQFENNCYRRCVE